MSRCCDAARKVSFALAVTFQSPFEFRLPEAEEDGEDPVDGCCNEQRGHEIAEATTDELRPLEDLGNRDDGQQRRVLGTARYFTPSGRSIQAKGISPDIEVLQDVPDDIKAKTDTSTKGEASLRGHLKAAEGAEQTGSQSYIPPEQKNDKALNMAMDLLRGVQVNSAFPPNPKTAVPN